MSEHQERVKDRLHELDIEADKVDPVKDQELYVEWNRRRWEEPGEWSFEPCQGFFDTVREARARTNACTLARRLTRSLKPDGSRKCRTKRRQKCTCKTS